MRYLLCLFCRHAIPILAFSLILASCASAGKEDWVNLKPKPDGSGPILRIAGTVCYLPLEGGLYVIRDPEGTQFNPLNLPEGFRIDGLAVEADARRRDDVLSIGMVGPIVELLKIRRLPGNNAIPCR